ncbi:MAG: patatin-like phospholipase family protein, partial [Pseudomonadota bacterium]
SNRLNEVIFNSNLLGELRSLGFIRNLVQDQEIDIDEYQNGRLHRIAAEDRMQELGVSSKMNASPDFLQFLFKLGHETADRWLATDGKLIGQNSTWHPGLAA